MLIKRFYRKILILSTKYSQRRLANKNNTELNVNRFITRILIIFSVILLIFEILFLAIYRLNNVNDYKKQIDIELEELKNQRNDLLALNTKLQRDNISINNKYEEMRKKMLENISIGNIELQNLALDYENKKAIAGMNSYSGSGIRITIKDKPGIKYDASTNALEIVHDGDLRYFVEFFKQIYAEAIAVNGERISSMSPLLCTGPSVLVNRVYHSSPFIIEAGVNIDRLDTIISILKADNKYLEMLDRGLYISIESVEVLDLAGMQDDIYIDRQVRNLGGK